MNERRFSRALRNVVRKFRDERERATVGRLNSGDGTYTIQVPERAGYVYVTMATGDVNHALWRGSVPLRASLPVKLLQRADGELVVDSEDDVLLTGDTHGPDEYGVLPHPFTTHTDVPSSYSGQAGKSVVVNVAETALEFGTPDVAAAIEAAADKTTPVDADDFGITDSAASNVLKKLSFANLATWIMGKIAALTAKTTPVDADSVVITDSAASDAPKRVTFANVTTYIMAKITALATKTTPVGADAIVITDSAASGVPKRVTFTNIVSYYATLFAVLAGTPGGQSLSGGNAANDDLTLQGTSHSTRTSSYVLLQPNGGQVAIGTVAPPAGHIFNASVDGAASFLSAISYGGHDNGFAFYGPRGTLASPSANLSGDPLGSIYFGGWDTALSNGARIYALAAADWGSAGDTSDNPTDLRFATVPDGSNTLTDRVAITSAGFVSIGHTAPQGIFHIHDGTTGWLKRTLAGVAGSEVTIIPNGTGDVLRGCVIGAFARGSSGTIYKLSVLATLDTPGAGSVEVDMPGLVITFKLYSTGELVVYRDSGSETFSISVDIMWQ